MSATVVKCCLLAAFVFSSASHVHGNPLKDPKRVIGGQTVDLNPLFQWWKSHRGPRPLTSWEHLTGSVVQETAWGWVVQAQIEDTSQAKAARGKKGAKAASATSDSTGTEKRIFLKNPPTAEKAQFDKLKAQLKDLENQKSKLSAVETKASKDAENAAGARRGRRGRAQAAENRQAKATEAQTSRQLKDIDQQIKDVNDKLAAYPSTDHYSLDCLALDAQGTHDGMPVYDYGTVLSY